MKTKLVVGLMAVALAVVGVVGMSSANAAPAAFTSSVPVAPLTAQSYNLLAVGGLLNVPPTEAANCGPGKALDINAPNLTVGTLASVFAVSDTCLIPSGGTTQATANAAKVSLLGGKINITGLRSQCYTNSAGYVTAESSIATINGLKVTLGALKITIPGIATVALDQNSQDPVNPGPGALTTVRSVGVLVQVLPYTIKVAGKSVAVPAQTISLDTCSITGYAPSST